MKYLDFTVAVQKYLDIPKKRAEDSVEAVFDLLLLLLSENETLHVPQKGTFSMELPKKEISRKGKAVVKEAIDLELNVKTVKKVLVFRPAEVYKKRFYKSNETIEQ